jgi:hypothetical protein
MSYNITITNHYHEALLAFGLVINAKDTRPVKIDRTLGNGYITVPGHGAVNFTDVGEANIGGYSKKTWGVLISYEGEEFVFRYEGGGQLQVTINKYGQAEMSGNGDFSRIRLDSFVVK